MATEILEGQSTPGPSGGQEATTWNKGPQSQGRVSVRKGFTMASMGAARKMNCLNSALGFPAEWDIQLEEHSLLQNLVIHFVPLHKDSF